MNQFRCFRALKREREAMQAINECLKRTDDEKVMGSLLSVALDIAGNVEGELLKRTQLSLVWNM